MAQVLSPSKITDYFPPSPTHGVSDSEDENLPVTAPANSLTEATSVILTPEHTPTKDDAKSQHKESASGKSCSDCGQLPKPVKNPTTKNGYAQHSDAGSESDSGAGSANSEELAAPDSQKEPAKTTTQAPKIAPGKGRRKGQGRAGVRSATNKSANSSSATSKKVPKKNPPESVNKKLTDYFPVRRSARMTSTELKKQQQSSLEEAVLSKCEDGLEVIDIEGKGRGVVACKKFKRGDFVVEYSGDLIDLSTAKDREGSYSRCSSIGCYMYYFVFQNKNYCIDATKESGRLGRLLNHSRYGNCATKLISVNNSPVLILVAAKDIKVGEELLYDYGDRSKESLEAHPWLAL